MAEVDDEDAVLFLFPTRGAVELNLGDWRILCRSAEGDVALLLDRVEELRMKRRPPRTSYKPSGAEMVLLRGRLEELAAVGELSASLLALQDRVN